MSESTKKPEMRGTSFIQPLEFGEWREEKVTKILEDILAKYSNSHDFELDHINRGDYIPCLCEPGCTDLVEIYGEIVFKRKFLDTSTKRQSYANKLNDDAE